MKLVDYGDTLEVLEDSPSFKSTKLLTSAHNGQTNLPDKTLPFLKRTASVVRTPKNPTITQLARKAASIIAKSRPMQSRKANLDLLEAHDEIDRAQEKLILDDDPETNFLLKNWRTHNDSVLAKPLHHKLRLLDADIESSVYMF
ncbi:hypothetical protein HYALB_00011880 [Hymenoscyphus albidus]|uniref:Uncharacterized protein n=1 Tax=Hymenoscyphus albidus TaxID=595503 RepID=A0A9N9LK66_9HELO|nr:hypothetical protein HYALB_00011880 [Hymenoscyphus albidus]